MNEIEIDALIAKYEKENNDKWEALMKALAKIVKDLKETNKELEEKLKRIGGNE